MLRMKKNVKEFLKANIKPEYFLDMVERIEGYKKFNEGTVGWAIYAHQSKSGVAFSFLLCSSDFEDVEDLEPNKWYPRERWNGNPDEYWLIERSEPDENGDGVMLTRCEKSGLFADTSHFMFIEPLEAEDDAS